VTEGAARVEAETLTESQSIQLQFWTAFREYVLTQASRLKPNKAFPQNWLSMAVGRSGFNLSAVALFWNAGTESYESNEIRAELVINDEYAKMYFAALEAEKETITTDLGCALIWHNPAWFV
jgi:hypothetical protein